MAKGHTDSANLHELLILTTNKITSDTVNAYFNKQHHDPILLAHLMQIALEGEDAGDASWAAANIIAGFPSIMLAKHKRELEILSDFD